LCFHWSAIVQRVDEDVVRSAVHSSGRVESLDPQSAELSLAQLQCNTRQDTTRHNMYMSKSGDHKPGSHSHTHSHTHLPAHIRVLARLIHALLGHCEAPVGSAAVALGELEHLAVAMVRHASSQHCERGDE
jgi:hypothetical protein